MAIQDEIKKKQPKPFETNDFGKAIKKNPPVLPKKGDRLSEIMRKLVFLAAVVVLVASLIILFDYFKQNYDAKKLNNELQNLSSSLAEVTPTETTTIAEDQPRPLLPLAETLLVQNPNTIGWIKVNNTKIDLPVVLKADEADDKKNTYYLTHNFLQEKASVGVIFADYRTTIEDRKQSDNIILYGHDEASNEMFGDLDLYKEKNGGRWNQGALDFYKLNPTFEFSTNYEKGTYKIFAYFVTAVNQEQDPDNEIFDYNNYIDFDEARYEEFMGNVMERNMIVTDIDCQYGDKFVTLSTCSDEFEPSRLVVFGRKVRDGEDTSVNVDKVTYNENALEPDYDYILNGK